MKKYSATTKGFYDTLIHTILPDDVVDVSDNDYNSLFESQALGYAIEPNDAGHPVANATPTFTFEEQKLLMTLAVSDFIDSKANDLGYSSIATAVSYADEPIVPKFQAEGKALRAWRSLVWARCYELLDEVIAGTRPVPTSSELMTLLPVFVPPL